MTKGRSDPLVIAMILTVTAVPIWLVHQFQGQFWFGLTFTSGAAVFWVKWIW